MTNDEHALFLGKIISSLQTLECLLRLALTRLEGDSDLDTLWLANGDERPECVMTDWRSLKQLVDDYNAKVSQELSIDDSAIVDLRDALAHGRVFTYTTAPFRLYRFGKPTNGRVRVEQATDMTPEWFDAQLQRINVAQNRVVRAREGCRAP